MILRITSMDDEAAGLLAAASDWLLHARFERSLILARAGDGALVSLLRHDLPDGPFAARLSSGAPRDLRSVASVPRLDWTGASRWQSEHVAPAEAVGADELVRRFLLLEDIAARADATTPRRGMLARGIEAVADEADLVSLQAAFASGDAAAAGTVAVRLAGLGPGLTPSGDDLLCGAMACHAWAELAGFGRSAAVPPAGAAFRAAVAEAAIPATSRFSAQALQAAARGHVAAPLAALLTSLFRRAATVPPDIAPLLAVGETSGRDLLAGVRLEGRALVTSARDRTAMSLT